MGTVFQIPWTYIRKEERYVKTLKDAGFTVISMALSDDAIPLTDPVLKQEISARSFSDPKETEFAPIPSQRAIIYPLSPCTTGWIR